MNKINSNNFINSKLNKNICSIVDAYLNYSIDNLIKLAINNMTNNCKFIDPNINLTDIIVLCCKTGYFGFYFSERYIDLLNKIKLMILKENLNNYLHIIKNQDLYYVEFKNYFFVNIPFVRFSCHIDSLNILKKY